MGACRGLINGSSKTDYPWSMRTSALLFKLLLVAGACAAPALQAKVLIAKIAHVKTGAGSLHSVVVRLEWPDGASNGTLSLRAARGEFSSMSYLARDLHWQCELARAVGGGWRCDGPLRSRGSKPARLSVNLSEATSTAQLMIGKSRLVYARADAAPDSHAVELHGVPVAWLKDFLAGLWADGRWTGGSLDGKVVIRAPKAAPFVVNTDVALAGVGLETPDGSLAAAALNGRLSVDYSESKGRQRVDSSFVARGGELLADRLYVVLPKSPVNIHVLAQRESSKQPWQLPQIQWQDAGVLAASGSASLDAANAVNALDLSLAVPNLSVARDRYFSGFLGPAGFPDLVLAGSVDARLQMGGGALTAMEARFGSVNAVDTKARFTFAGIDGSLRWTTAGNALASELRWTDAAIFGIGLGPARFGFGSSIGELRLAQPVPIDALQGKLVLDHLRWQARAKGVGATFQFGMSVQALDLASLSQRLGWPAFPGSITGKIPSARFRGDVLDFDGGLQMNLFDGQVELSDLSMERPFGVAPTLTGDVVIKDIDLEPMTRVFGFGAITGRLDGRISKLRLVDWAPVAFDARLETDREWKGKRRISQRAVKDISNVGGSGVAGGIQAQALKLFDDFAYDRIGLACKLQDNVCTMDGVGSAGDGYIIVAGAGLPRIQVVGFRRKVDWPTLLARLEAATQGQAPVIK